MLYFLNLVLVIFLLLLSLCLVHFALIVLELNQSDHLPT